MSSLEKSKPHINPCDKVKIFDTTLRDGEQAPGFSMNHKEKLDVALQLANLGVDIIEAGFPIASPGDFKAVQDIAAVIKGAEIAGLARALEKDISVAAEAIAKAEQPRIHIFIASSPIHRQYKLKKSADQVLEQAAAMTRFARNLVPNVEFSAEDATRTELDFLCKLIETVIAQGATTVNIPDTVGYIQPGEFAELITTIRQRVVNIDKAVLSVHCHDDLGLAVANSLAAVKAGARQVEVAVNGIGERAGNAALEEVVMNIRTRQNYYQVDTAIDSAQLFRTSHLVQRVTGVKVTPNKAIVGRNAFAHESGIHQHGVLANPLTYEIMTPASVGVDKTDMVLGKHSGRHALQNRLQYLGYNVAENILDELFVRFKKLADDKKTITDSDIESLLRATRYELADSAVKTCELVRFAATASNDISAVANIVLQIPTSLSRFQRKDDPNDMISGVYNAITDEDIAKNNTTGDNLEHLRIYNIRQLQEDTVNPQTDATDTLYQVEMTALGDGPVDACLNAINSIIKLNFTLEEYNISAVTSGTDALGEVTLRISDSSGNNYTGYASTTDVVESSIRAYLSAINSMLRHLNNGFSH